MIKRSCEDPNTIYVTIFKWRFIFRTNYLKYRYAGWYEA